MYTRRVGFNTFEAGAELDQTGNSTGGGTGVNFSFTTSAKSAGYARTKGTRTFLVGTDLNEYSKHALSFALAQLAEDHDEIVILRVIDEADKNRPSELEEAKAEAEDMLEQVMKENGEELQISIIVEFAIGPIEETIHRMIEVYTPDSLIVGTRGLPDSVWKSAFMGSISRYCVARSPVPVVVVRPSEKVAEDLSRRSNDPKRRSYVSLLGHHGAGGLELERMKTAPSTSDRKMFVKDKEKKENKKDKKGLEFKRFGTFS